MVIPCELWQLGFDCEISNNSAMVTELILALIFGIGLSIFFYKRQEIQRKKIDKIILNQHKVKKERLEFFLKNHPNFLADAKTYIDFFRKNRKSEDEKIQHESEMNKILAKISFDSASKYLENTNDLIQPDLLHEIRSLIRAGKCYCELGMFPDTTEEDFSYDYDANWDKDIDDVLNKLNNLKKEMKIEISS